MELKIRLKRIVFVFLVVAGLLLGFYWIFLFWFSLIFSFEFLFFFSRRSSSFIFWFL